MDFRILEIKNGDDKKYEIRYKDDYDNRGPRWQKVIWDEGNYRNFKDTNFTSTIDEAMFKAAKFKEDYERKHGTLVKELSL